jgi:hypothetical protein
MDELVNDESSCTVDPLCLGHRKCGVTHTAYRTPGVAMI